ncbi:DUF5677 domain-containing protein [Lysinibacillus pakistanensis]|uniref:DUF5677 domain-containing protein n=1 Tax=Lysinibacillus pakistanensis TaxID=759811 RepID=UPI003D29C01A
MDFTDKIAASRKMIEFISEDFLQNGRPFIIQNEFELIRELIVLYAKQTNLFESIIVLLENNQNEEALILNRSLINNAFLIHYLYNKNSDKRYKDYKIQHVKSNLKRFNKYKSMLEKGYFENVDFQPLEMEEVEEKIADLESILINNGYVNNQGKVKTNLLTVSSMAEEDPLLYSYYAHNYDIGSRYEHSDSLSLNIYKQPALDADGVFIIDLSQTDEELGEEVIDASLQMYILTFVRLTEYIERACPILYEKLLLGRAMMLANEYFLFLENQNNN